MHYYFIYIYPLHALDGAKLHIFIYIKCVLTILFNEKNSENVFFNILNACFAIVVLHSKHIGEGLKMVFYTPIYM